MKCLLIFPPGWMQFGPYLSLPLLKGCLRKAGFDAKLLDLNIEFYDWVTSAETLDFLWPRLRARERDAWRTLPAPEYARLAKALLCHESLRERVDQAKAVLRSKEQYLDQAARERAKADLCSALNVAECAFDRFQLSMNQILFGCGRNPERAIQFLRSDANIIRLFYEQRARELLTGGPFDLIGLSLPAWEQMVPALTLAACLRDDFGQGPHICMGGNYVTRLVGTWGDRPHPYTNLVDSFSVFEGENSLIQLSEAVSGGRPLASVENLAYCDGDRLHRTPPGSVDVDAIPAPDFDGLPLHKYFAPEPILPLFTSRSCAYKCSFCTIPYASSEFRQRSAENVVADMALLSKRYDTSLFTFVDETLMLPALRGVAERLIDADLDVRWYGETRFHPKFEKDLARTLFRSGCRKLQFGLESYNQRVLNLMKKGVRLDCISPNVEACLEAGIAIHLFTFAGFPGETEEEARRTQEFAQQVVTLSAEKYGVPYSTVGSGAFNLEVYSDVYYHPERYGVTFQVNVNALEADEAFEIEYAVESGLTREQAARLVREFDNSAVFQDACDVAGLVWWKALLGNQTNEDEDFLLYCYGVTRDEAETPDPRPVQHPYLSPGAAARLRLAPGIVTREFSRDFMRADWQPPEDGADAVPRRVVAFYDREQDLPIVVPSDLGERALAWLGEDSRPVEPDTELLGLLNRLLRHGLLHVVGAGCRRSLSGGEMLRRRSAELGYNDDVQVLRLPSAGIVLFNATTQDVVRINTSAAWIASLARERRRSAADFIGHVAADSSLPQPSIEVALAELVDRQVLIAVTAD